MWNENIPTAKAIKREYKMRFWVSKYYLESDVMHIQMDRK